MLGNLVREAARRFRDRAAIVSADGWSLSYLDLFRLSEQAAAGLRRRGVDTGDVVVLAMRSSPDYAIAYLAGARIGAITAGVNPRFASQERACVIDRAVPKLVLAEEDLTEGIPSGVDTEIVRPASIPEEILISLRMEAETVAERIDPRHPVAIVFTSGTTGEPKGAVFANRQLAAITMFDTGGRWDGGGPMLSSTEMCHVGFMTKLPWYLRTGSRIHLLQKWRAEDALRTICDQRMPSIGGIGAQVALMLRLPDFDDYDVEAVKAIVVGGGPSPASLIEEARRRFHAAYSVRYSSTESGGVGTLTAFDAPDEEALHTVGRPRDGIDLEIRNEEGIPVAHGEVGEITLRSSATMSEYWRDPVSTRHALRDGWLFTGDLGSVDARGCLRMAGRAKEMYIRGGYNVYPMEVETVLMSHPLVADVCVVPRADDVMGEIGVAVVVARGGTRGPSLEALRVFAADRLAAYKLPEALRLVDELPLTGMHKVDRGELASREAGRDGAPE